MVYLVQSGDMEYVDEDKRTKYLTARPDHDVEVLSLPNLWAEWVHTGRLTATSNICHYAGIDCKQFCTTATHFGGRLCEYLKARQGVRVQLNLSRRACTNIPSLRPSLEP
ncbi:Kcnh7 [Symbiodinium natans]|uniref:Kcnh7 protein n=1 Tax=Symbiodinium natans TaxID=878477 RepID=A0A812QFW0_9DINO|nr:Kcnh7 [Symbiodinium natans]